MKSGGTKNTNMKRNKLKEKWLKCKFQIHKPYDNKNNATAETPVYENN